MSNTPKIDEILIDLAHKSNHLSERYEFEESILHKGTHLSNAKDQILELIREARIDEVEQMTNTTGFAISEHLQSRLTELKKGDR